MQKHKTADAIEILQRRYIGDDLKRAASLQEERVNAQVARTIRELREDAGLTQKELAEMIETTQSVVSRLEDADYEGHSLSMLDRIARALNQRVSISVASEDRQVERLHVESSPMPAFADIQNRLLDLLRYPREEPPIELKGWLDPTSENDKANLAQAMLALANHGGGYLILGFTESAGNWQPAGEPLFDAGRFTQDLVNGIVRSYAEPAFHCEVHHVKHPDTGFCHPIISVPGGHKVPVRAKRDGPNRSHVRENTYYVRGPGPESRPIHSAREWDELIRRCLFDAKGELLNSFRSILLGEAPLSAVDPGTAIPKLEEWIRSCRSRFSALNTKRISEKLPDHFVRGTWTVGYQVIGALTEPSPRELLELLRKVKGHETGWPPWWIPTVHDIAPYPFEGYIECWLGRHSQHQDPAHSDFWRASPRGMMFLLRGYQEDEATDRRRPGTEFEFTLPLWRVAECLLHAERFANELAGSSASVAFRVIWEGLNGRLLTSWNPMYGELHQTHRCRQDAVSSYLLLPADQISAGLPEIVQNLTKPLYEAFDFFEIPKVTIDSELLRLRRGG
jgi:transcriptional regulator with XRE-family HTH domain